jgi:hypothetical protein
LRVRTWGGENKQGDQDDGKNLHTYIVV